MFRIEVDGVPVGGIGCWQVEHEGVPAWETGWGVEPEWQGRGVARAALRLVIRRVADDGTRRLLVAYPGVDKPRLEPLCRGAGFEHIGTQTRCRGADGELTFNTWVLDMSPLDLEGREPEVDETFDGGDLDRARWWPFYTPHWASRRDDRGALAARRRRARAADRRRHPAVGARRSTATCVSRTCRPASSRGRSAARSASTGSARGSSSARSSPSSGCGWRTTASSRRGSPPSGIPTRWSRSGRSGSRSGPTTAARLCIAEIFGSGDRRRRRLGRRRRQAAERPAAACGLREDPRRGRPHRVPRLRRRVDARAGAVLHRRALGEDRRAVDRLPRAVHARRVRVPPRRRHARHGGAAARVPRAARADLPARRFAERLDPGARTCPPVMGNSGQSAAVAEPEQRVGRVEGHVGPGCLDRGHRARQVERQLALRLRRRRVSTSSSAAALAPQFTDTAAATSTMGVRMAGRSGRRRRPSAPRGDLAARGRSPSAGKSSEPAWKKFSNIVPRVLVRRLQAQDRDVRLGRESDDGRRTARRPRRRCPRRRGAAPRASGRAAALRRRPLVSSVIDARCAASPAARNVRRCRRSASARVVIHERVVEQAELELLAQQAAGRDVDALLADLAGCDEVDQQSGQASPPNWSTPASSDLDHALARRQVLDAPRARRERLADDLGVVDQAPVGADDAVEAVALAQQAGDDATC